MSPTATLLTVAFAHLLAMASPGPNVLLVARTAMAESRRRALAIAVGIATGGAILIAAAAFGLGLVVERADWLRYAIQLAGGAYLLWLGVMIWRSAREPMPEPDEAGGTRDPGRPWWRDFLLGLFTNLSNPKALIFYGSIIGPTLDPGTPTWVMVAAVGVILVDSTIFHCLLAVLFARPGVQRRYGRAKLTVDRVVGFALTLIGAELALSVIVG